MIADRCLHRYGTRGRVALVALSIGIVACARGTAGAQRATIVLIPSAGPRVTVRAEIAATPEAWLRGLRFRERLGEREGMWFIFPHDVRYSFTMTDTPIALDIIFVSAAFRVVDLIPDVTPRTSALRPPRVAYRYVLEVPAGSAARWGVTLGDRVGVGASP